MVIFAGYKVGKTAVIDKTTIMIVLGTINGMLIIHIHQIITILLGAILGLLLQMMKGIKRMA